MRRAAVVLAVAAGLLSSAAPSGAAEPLPVGSDFAVLQQGDHLLSDEKRLTRWVRAYSLAPVRRKPRRESRVITRLRYHTEDGPPEVYLALRSHADARGRVWIQLRLPMRPNGTKGWVRVADVGAFNVVRTHLRIDRAALRATLYRSGRRIWTSRIGIGAPGTPTPRGRFYIRERLRSLGGAYGPWAFGTSAYSDRLTDWPGGGVVGIHGTNQPQLIPGRPSHGCVRVPNRKVRRLARIMPIGTPVHIR